MSLFKFLASKTFAKQLLLAIVALTIFCFILLKWLKSVTNHGDFITVPNLTGKPYTISKLQLKENNLAMQFQDSSDFNPDYPKLSVIEQNPPAGSKVKEGRKIYLILNPSGYKKIAVPDLTERTLRQVKPTLKALGFEVGKITYVNNIGKDVVLKMIYKGKEILPNTKLTKTSKIDLVLGNGNRP